MEITFLGHQGWLFQASSGEKILLDPLLKEMGNGVTKINVWPNRELDLYKIGKINSLIISHEHADHFHIETLLKIHLINKPNCVYVPNISTRALKNALVEIGFSVKELISFEILNIGTLNIIPLPSVKSRFEPDVYSLFVEDVKSKSSFYTPIDTVPSQLAINFLKDYCPVRTLDNYTNNFVQRIPTLHCLNLNVYTKSAQDGFKYLEKFVANFLPQKIIISGQGWSYTKKLSTHNNLMFTLSHNDICKKAKKSIGVEIFEAVTDVTYVLKKNQLVSKKSNYTIPLPLDDRMLDLNKLKLYKLTPYCDVAGEKSTVEFVLSFVENELGPLLALGASKLNKALYSLLMESDSTKRGFFIELRSKNKSYQYEYSYSDSLFYPLIELIDQETAMEVFEFGLICFILDLNEIICAREEGHLISENSMITWNNRFDLLNELTDIDFMNCFRPQYRAVHFEKFYISEIKRLRIR
jgi:hypothetical protein